MKILKVKNSQPQLKMYYCSYKRKAY